MALKDNEEGEILSVGMVRGEETREGKTWTAWEWQMVWLIGWRGVKEQN